MGFVCEGAKQNGNAWKKHGGICELTVERSQGGLRPECCWVQGEELTLEGTQALEHHLFHKISAQNQGFSLVLFFFMVHFPSLEVFKARSEGFEEGKDVPALAEGLELDDI